MFPASVTLGMVALVALNLAPLPQASSQSALPCQSGLSAGTFLVPEFSGGAGFMSGALYQGDFLVVKYQFDASLEEIASPCLSCIQGLIDGTLDDGIGPGPDYVVRGWYQGPFFIGEGSFAARVFRTSGGPAVGRIRGTFFDSPADQAPGSFHGGWRICD